MTLHILEILPNLLLWPSITVGGTPEQSRESPHTHRLFVVLFSVELIGLKVIARKRRRRRRCGRWILLGTTSAKAFLPACGTHTSTIVALSGTGIVMSRSRWL